MIITHVYEVFRSRLIQTSMFTCGLSNNKNLIKDTLLEKKKKTKAKKVVNTRAYILHKYQMILCKRFNTLV